MQNGSAEEFRTPPDAQLLPLSLMPLRPLLRLLLRGLGRLVLPQPLLRKSLGIVLVSGVAPGLIAQPIERQGKQFQFQAGRHVPFGAGPTPELGSLVAVGILSIHGEPATSPPRH